MFLLLLKKNVYSQMGAFRITPYGENIKYKNKLGIVYRSIINKRVYNIHEYKRVTCIKGLRASTTAYIHQRIAQLDIM